MNLNILKWNLCFSLFELDRKNHNCRIRVNYTVSFLFSKPCAVFILLVPQNPFIECPNYQISRQQQKSDKIVRQILICYMLFATIYLHSKSSDNMDSRWVSAECMSLINKNQFKCFYYRQYANICRSSGN